MTLAGIAAPAVAQEQSSRFSGAPRIGSSESWSLKPRGRIQYDAGNVSAPAGVAASGIGGVHELRRARLGIEGTAPGHLSYLFDLELAEGIAEVTEATVTWSPPGGFAVTIGQHNNFQSLEELTSDRFTSFLERAAFTDAFNFEYRLGVSATYTHGPLTVQAGAFTDNLLEIDEGDDQLSLDGRIVYAPRFGRTQLHFGGSVHWRDNGDLLARGTRTRYRQRPAIHATDTRFIGTPALAVDRETDWGVEAAAIHGPFHVAVEAHWFQPEVTTAAENPGFFGGYVELGWFVTGESRGYRGGRWDRTRVRRGGAIEEGGFGAIQLNVRYDRLDLNSAGVTGGTQDGLLAGIIWIPTDYVRVLANYARLSYRDAAIRGPGGRRDYGVDVLGVRAQLDF